MFATCFKAWRFDNAIEDTAALACFPAFQRKSCWNYGVFDSNEVDFLHSCDTAADLLETFKYMTISGKKKVKAPVQISGIIFKAEQILKKKKKKKKCISILHPLKDAMRTFCLLLWPYSFSESSA